MGDLGFSFAFFPQRKCRNDGQCFVIPTQQGIEQDDDTTAVRRAARKVAVCVVVLDTCSQDRFNVFDKMVVIFLWHGSYIFGMESIGTAAVFLSYAYSYGNWCQNPVVLLWRFVLRNLL